MNIDELRKKRQLINQSTNDEINELQKLIEEAERVRGLLSEPDKLFNQIDLKFKELTALNEIDTLFIVFAASLQTLKWVLLPELKIPNIAELEPSISKEERMKSNERNHIGGIYDGKKSGSEYEIEKLEDYKNAHLNIKNKSEHEFYQRKSKYRTWIEILSQPVPFDALNANDKKFTPNIAGLNKQNKDGTYNNIYAKNHHVASLGHDPVLGWFFGTLNILTNTITYADFQSFDVKQGRKIRSTGEFITNKELLFSDQIVYFESRRTLYSIFNESMLSIEEDYKRLVAAIVRESIHLTSDKYCVQGLPIPILSTIDPIKAQEMIENGWNSIEFNKLILNDVKEIATSTILGTIINIIIQTIYLYCFDSVDDLNIRKVKIKKILNISNSIASSSNVFYVILTNKIGKIDIGGYILTISSLLKSADFIQSVKLEFMKEELDHLLNTNLEGNIE